MGESGAKHDETSRPLALGEGRISGYLSVTLGALSVFAVACFLFPDVLTTPTLRAGYDLTALRWTLAGGMLFSVGFGLTTFFLGRRRRLGALGISLTLLAMLMGGPTVPVGPRYDTAGIFVGLDWFVIDLLISAVVFVFLEKVAPRIRDQAVLRPDFWHDARYFAFNHLAIGIFLYATVVIVPGLFAWGINEGVQAWFRGQWAIVQFAIIMISADVVEYWIHRTMHEVKWLWPIHAVHHSAEHMDWLAGSRLHILEPLVTRMLVMLPAFILGAEGAPLLCYIVFAGFQAGLAHANFGVDFGWLKYVFNTPQFHHWHHSSEREAVDRNYAAHLPIVDRIFGTYYMPPDQWPAKYGVIGDPLPKGMVRQFLHPFRRRPTP